MPGGRFHLVRLTADIRPECLHGAKFLRELRATRCALTLQGHQMRREMPPLGGREAFGLLLQLGQTHADTIPSTGFSSTGETALRVRSILFLFLKMAVAGPRYCLDYRATGLTTMESLPEIFRSIAKKVIEADPQKTSDHVLEKEGANWRLRIPKQEPSGFDITVIADESEVTVYTEYGAHRHYTSDGKHEETVQMALGLVRDLLSENMRVRVFVARGKPYRFDLEWCVKGRRNNDGRTGLFVLPWFGKKTQKLYSNHRLPPRSYD